jgi:hypothetical protein
MTPISTHNQDENLQDILAEISSRQSMHHEFLNFIVRHDDETGAAEHNNKNAETEFGSEF